MPKTNSTRRHSTVARSKWVALEFGSNDSRSVWGPFASKQEADGFVNSRIALLASEWGDSEGIITEHLQWEVLETSYPY
jgi:hypothetical protein